MQETDGMHREPRLKNTYKGLKQTQEFPELGIAKRLKNTYKGLKPWREGAKRWRAQGFEEYL